MKRIVIIVSSLRRSGPIVVVQNLLRNIDRNKFDVQIVKLMEDEPSRSITSEFINDGLIVHELHSTKLKIELFPHGILKQLRKLLNVIKPDLIHTHGYQACLLGAKLADEYKVVETLHCIAKEDFISSKGHILGRYMLYRYFNCLKKICGAAAISDTVKKYYELKLKNIKVRLVYNGVAIATQLPSKDIIREKLKISISDKVFLVIASLSKRKDPLLIIRSFKKAFPLNDHSVKLLFLGKGNLHDVCLSEIGVDNRIKLLGWQPNVSDYLAASDYTISASHSEGFGLNFIESVTAGVPVIGTDIPPFMEFYNIFRELQPLNFKVGNETELSEVLRKAVRMDIEMSEYSSIAKELFSAKTMAKNYENFYNDLIEN